MRLEADTSRCAPGAIQTRCRRFAMHNAMGCLRKHFPPELEFEPKMTVIMGPLRDGRNAPALIPFKPSFHLLARLNGNELEGKAMGRESWPEGEQCRFDIKPGHNGETE
jgi:hypothetical protein